MYHLNQLARNQMPRATEVLPVLLLGPTGPLVSLGLAQLLYLKAQLQEQEQDHRDLPPGAAGTLQLALVLSQSTRDQLVSRQEVAC